jgi:ParB family chromosome partitioning protein
VSLRDVQREFKELPLAAIDPPELDARLDRDRDKLEELAKDIAKRGVILPIAVVRMGDRYEVVDGQTRYLAAERAQLATIPAMIYPSKDVALEGVKYAANLHRIDMSPAEEAVFFNELLSKECGNDFEQLCTLVGRGEAYVDNRLALLNGDDEIFNAVRTNQIKLGVAAELNKIPDESWRRWYLHHAIRGGATVAMVTGWVSEWRSTHASDAPAAPEAAAPAVQVVQNSYNPHRCEICGKVDPRYVPETISVHTHCRVAILEPLLEAYRDGNS